MQTGFSPAWQAVMAMTKLILLTGATGYIGGRLLKELEGRG
jgi:nucleoside-diphosphate-sugar epimerase